MFYKTSKPHVALLYIIKGYAKEVSQVFQMHRVEAYLKPRNTLRQLLSVPNHPSKTEQVSGVVYKIDCGVWGVEWTVRNAAAHT